MNADDIIERIKEEEMMCEYCGYNNECPHGMACYGGEPIEPPCTSVDCKNIIDYEPYAHDNEIEIEVEHE